MSRRADHPLPPSLFDLTWDQKIGKYVITRKGITYQIDFHHYNDLKAYFRQIGDRANIEDWYRGLDREWRLQVTRLGLPEQPDDFFPDPDYD